MAIIATKHVHVVLINYTGMRMTRAWSLLRIQRLKLLPCARLNAISVEVVNSVVAVVTTENVDASAVDYSCVAVTRTWWL